MAELAKGIAGYWAWLKAMLADDELQQIAEHGKHDIRIIAIGIASFGQSGRGCWAASGAVGDLIGCHRNTVDKYKIRLIELGWFKVVTRKGGNRRRSVVVDISLPAKMDPWAEFSQLHNRGV